VTFPGVAGGHILYTWRCTAVSRLDIRVDPVWKGKLRDLAQAMGTTTSEVVRRLVEEAHARLRQERRRQAAARIAAASLPVPDDPRELCRELEEAHGAGAR